MIKLETNDPALPVPHVGWNNLIQLNPSRLFDGLPEEALFYYVHSFHIRCCDRSLVAGECEYGTRFAAVLQKDNIYATQFHPEKSQLHGLTLLRNFLNGT